MSVNAVPIIVKLPPSSKFLAAPKNLFGKYKPEGSSPPDNVLPEGGTVKFEALASLVIESSKITTSRFASTSLFAFSSARLATLICSSAGLSNVDAITSPSIERDISVTSSGRSSINNAIMIISGELTAIARAIRFNNVVLPALGGETIKALCPSPIGANISTSLVAKSSLLYSRLNLTLGNIGVSCAKTALRREYSGSEKFTVSTRSKASF